MTNLLKCLRRLGHALSRLSSKPRTLASTGSLVSCALSSYIAPVEFNTRIYKLIRLVAMEMYDPAKAIAVVQGYFPDYTVSHT